MTEELDARALFTVAPAEYVGQRTELAVAAKAAGNKAAAAAFKALVRPNLSMWAVLAAGADERAVRFLLTSTDEVAQTQSGGGNSAAIASAMQHRRTAIDALVDAAVGALRQWDDGAEARRAEIRTIVDKLSRVPWLADSWLAGTLRELPDDTLGFTSFSEMIVPERPSTADDKPSNAAKPSRAKPVAKAAVAEPVDTPEMRAARTAHVVAQREARKDLSIANRDLIAATRTLENARNAQREADEAVHLAEVEHAQVIARRADAEERLATPTAT